MVAAKPFFFIRAYPGGPKTLCCEPVMDWLAFHGDAHGLDRRAQRLILARLGFWRGCQAVMARLGRALVHPVGLEAGEAVIFRLPDGRACCGLALGSGAVAGFTAGILYAGRFPVLRVARKAIP